MMAVGRYMVDVIERKNQAEADFKYVVARVNTRTTLNAYAEDAADARSGPERSVIGQWKRLCGQHMRAHASSRTATRYSPRSSGWSCVRQTMSWAASRCGEVTQAAAAFVAVQGAFNWLVDNYPRLAEWMSSAYRVGVLLMTLDALDTESATAASIPRQAKHIGQRTMAPNARGRAMACRGYLAVPCTLPADQGRHETRHLSVAEDLGGQIVLIALAEDRSAYPASGWDSSRRRRRSGELYRLGGYCREGSGCPQRAPPSTERSTTWQPAHQRAASWWPLSMSCARARPGSSIP